ncbi:pilin [Patescibacteria group bacterium]|nr:pilin [Patescibacteria group bacterium]MBU4347311.1 pilin [Patescibacteria group bacterium]MBU4455284.1 pilin [Patescibacteria group bacterium]
MKKYLKFIIPFSIAAIIILFFAININIVQAVNTCPTQFPGYQCMDKSQGTDCKAGYCLDNPDVNFQCCKQKTSAGTGILPAGAEKGDYTLNDFIQLAVNISKWLLGITGSLALLAFIYGGVVFLISAGNTEMVARGKKIIIGAVIGLVIVFASYTIISFVFTAFEVPGGGNWATSGWFK